MRLQCRPGGFSKIPSRWGYFYADRGLSQTSAQAFPATAILPNENPPRSHHKTTKLPQAEIAEGSIFTVASSYGTAGDVSMIDSLENSVYMYLAFRQACTNDKYYDKTAHAQTDPHVSIWRESAFGGNLRVL